MVIDMLNLFKNLFKEPSHPRKKTAYAVTKGAFLGEILIYVCSISTHHCFLSIPKMENRQIPKEKFDFGLENGILEQVESLPGNVFDTVEKQYKKNESTN
jgi:hypothetical protein